MTFPPSIRGPVPEQRFQPSRSVDGGSGSDVRTGLHRVNNRRNVAQGRKTGEGRVDETHRTSVGAE